MGRRRNVSYAPCPGHDVHFGRAVMGSTSWWGRPTSQTVRSGAIWPTGPGSGPDVTTDRAYVLGAATKPWRVHTGKTRSTGDEYAPPPPAHAGTRRLTIGARLYVATMCVAGGLAFVN